MDRPLGVYHLPVVSLSAYPSSSGYTDCTNPLPNDVCPTISARSWSCRAPATISAADAVDPSVSTISGIDPNAGAWSVESTCGGPVRVRTERISSPALRKRPLSCRLWSTYAAGIAPLVENDAARALLLQRPRRLGDVARRRLIELLQRDVPDVAGQHERVRHRGHVNHGARELDRDRLRHAGASEPDLHLGARRAGQIVGGLRERPATCGERVDPQDLVALDDAGGLGRRVREDLAHGDDRRSGSRSACQCRRTCRRCCSLKFFSSSGENSWLYGSFSSRTRPVRRLLVHIPGRERVDVAVGDQ